MKIRIAIVTYSMVGGGIERFILQLGYYLNLRNMDVEIITTEQRGPWFSKAAEFGLSIRHIDGIESSQPLDHIKRVADELIIGEYDVIFLNHARFAQACIGLLPDHMKVIPIIHNDDAPTFDLSCANDKLWNTLVCVSPKIAKEIKKRVPSKPVQMIPNGINRVQVDNIQPRKYSEKTIRLLYVGRLYHRQKGVLYLPKIMRELIDLRIDVTLDIVGDGHDYSKLLREVEDLKIKHRVFFHGMLETKEVYRMMYKSHFLLLPSIKEGFGIVLIEAMMTGCIPIATKIEGVTDFVIKDGETGILVDSNSIIDGFSKAIVDCTRNKELNEQISMKAIQHAISNFNFETVGESYYKLIADSLANKFPLHLNKSRSLLKGSNYLEKSMDIIFMSESKQIQEYYKQWMRFLINGSGITSVLHSFDISRVAIFGTLKAGVYLLNDLTKEGIDTITFLDNNVNDSNRYIANIEINHPSWLLDNFSELDAILISIESNHDLAVKNQLEDLIGTYEIKVFTWKQLVVMKGSNRED